MPDFKTKAEFPNCKVVDISQLAIEVDIDGVLYWIPQSQVDDDSEIWENGQEGTLVVSEWIAKEKGLI
jgi:hypothetical protein